MLAYASGLRDCIMLSQSSAQPYISPLSGHKPDIYSTLNRVLSSTLIAFGVSDACLVLFDADSEPGTLLMIKKFQMRQYSPSNWEELLSQGLIQWVKEHRQGTIIINADVDERWYSRLNIRHPFADAQSAVAAPLQTSHQLIGVLVITAPTVSYFDTRDLRMITIMSDLMAFTIASVRQLKTEQQRHQLTDTLTHIARTINSTLDLDEVLNLILEQLALVIEYDSSSVLLYEEETQTLSVQAARGHDDLEDALRVKIPVNEASPTFQAIKQRKPVALGDVDKIPGWIKSASSRNVHSWIGAPLIARNQIIGMLTVDSHEVDKYTEKDVQTMAAFADYVATAVANARVVTQLKNVESSYAALFEDSTDMIIITSYQGQIINVNRKAGQMLRLPKDALIGMEINFLYPKLGDFLAEQTHRLKAWREATLEVDLKDAYHQPLSLEFKIRQVNYSGKNCVQWVGRDISARKEMERMRQDLVDMLVHDIRGPVGNLINIIEMLPMLVASGAEQDSIGRMLEMARQTGQDVRDLLDTMLDISRLEKDEVPLQRDMHNIGEIIQAVEKQIAPRAQAKNITLSITLLPDIPPLWIDGSMIRRILVNLMDNAVKYTPPQGQVSLTTTLKDNALIFAVSDNGSGIRPEDQKRIFNKFSRVNSSQGDSSGVGLGLAFCKLAAEAHGGSIWVESEGIPGKGSTFYLSIPLTAEPSL